MGSVGVGGEKKKEAFLWLLHSLSEHQVEDYLVTIRGKTLLQQDK